jgi:hypothetical protein
MTRWRAALRFLVAAVLLLGASYALSAADTDRNCEFAGQGRLPPGTHSGTFSSQTAFHDSSQFKMSLLQTFKGTFTLVVDKQGNVTSATGNVDYSLVGSTVLKGFVAAGLNETASGTIEKSGGVNEGTFSLFAKMAGSAHIFSRGYNREKGDKTMSGEGNVLMTFMLPAAECSELHGTWQSESLSGPAARLAAKGYSVLYTIQRWEITGHKPPRDEIKEFRQRVEEALKVAPNLNQRRIAKQRMDKLANEIQQKHEGTELGKCLHKVWLEGAHQMFTAWLNEDLPKLKAYNGDAVGLRDLTKRVLDSDAWLVILGIDGCSRDLHVRVWSTVKSTFTRVLTRAYDVQAIADLLALTKNADIIGQVSPELYEDVLATLRDIAKKHLEQVKAEIDRYKDRGYKPTECNKYVYDLVRKAMFAARQGELLGVQDHGVTKACGQLISTMSTNDLRECRRQQRQENIDKFGREHPQGGGT